MLTLCATSMLLVSSELLSGTLVAFTLRDASMDPGHTWQCYGWWTLQVGKKRHRLHVRKPIMTYSI